MSSAQLAAPQTLAPQTPSPGPITQLNIDGNTLLDTLSNQQASVALYLSSSNISTLSIVDMAGCSSRLEQQVLDRLFEFLQSLTKLCRLSISGFTLGPAATTLPACLWNLPISVTEVTVTSTHGASLSYLLQCLNPRELRLASCWFVQDLPTCAALTLDRIHSFDGFAKVLSGWDGGRLHIEDSPFLDEGFVQDLRRRMEEDGKPIWPHTNGVSYEGCSLEVRIKMAELLDVRAQLKRFRV